MLEAELEHVHAAFIMRVAVLEPLAPGAVVETGEEWVACVLCSDQLLQVAGAHQPHVHQRGVWLEQTVQPPIAHPLRYRQLARVSGREKLYITCSTNFNCRC